MRQTGLKFRIEKEAHRDINLLELTADVVLVETFLDPIQIQKLLDVPVAHAHTKTNDGALYE